MNLNFTYKFEISMLNRECCRLNNVECSMNPFPSIKVGSANSRIQKAEETGWIKGQ